jgi:O-antigen ligase/tetratricopeptide (TPR) repeat protein
MSSPQERMHAAAPALVIHDAALLLLAIYAPVFWGSFSTAGQAMAAALVGVAALSAFAWRLIMRRTPSVIPNALHLPALALLAITAIATPFSASIHASLLELSRLVVGALLLALVANRALLPASPTVPVVAVVAVSVVVLPFVKIIGESDLTLDVLTTVAVTAVVARLLTTQHHPDPVRRWVEALLFCAALTVGIYGIREKIITSYVMEPRNPSWQVFSTFYNPNSLGGFIAMVLPLVLSLALAAVRRAERVLWAVLAVVLAVELVPTNSKGAELALAVALVVYCMLLAVTSRRPRRNVALVMGTLGAVVVLAAGTLVVSGAIRHTVFAALSQQSASNMFRILTWKGALKMALAHPWLGVGPGAFSSVYMNYAIGGYTQAAHQNYLQVAAEQGPLGLLAFLWLLGAALFTGWRALRRPGAERGDRLLAAGGLAAVVVFMVHSFFDYDWYIGAINVAFWLVAGTLAHLAHGRPLLVPEVQSAPTPRTPAPRKGKRRRLGTVVAWRLPDETATHRFRATATPARQAVTLTVAAAVLGGCFLAPALNAFAQRAIGAGERAMALMDSAYRQGNTALTAQQREVAYRSFQEAAAYDPLWSAAHERAGLSTPDEQEAVKELRYAIHLEPRNFQPYLSLARYYESRGWWSDAVEAYRESVARYPGNTKTLRLLAAAYQQSGDQVEAINTYRRLLAVKDSPAARYVAISIDTDTNYAYAYYELGREALAEYKRDGRAEHLGEALDLFSQAQLLIEAYFRPGTDTGQSLDALFLQLGKPRQDRALELKPILAKAYWRKAKLFYMPPVKNVTRGTNARRLALETASEAGIDVAQEVAREDRGPGS